MPNSKRKGNSLERELCKRLSLWWTQDRSPPRDDVFWRTSNSGGRATVRGRQGKKTRNSYSDISAVDVEGQPLLDLLVIEVKSGYNKFSLMDLIDRPGKAAQQQWDKWISKAEEDATLAGVSYWLLITKRDKRQALVTMPTELCARFYLLHRLNMGCIRVDLSYGLIETVTMTLDFFLEWIQPKAIREIKNEQQSPS